MDFLGLAAPRLLDRFEVGIGLAAAAAAGALSNVRINLEAIKDEKFRADLTARIEAIS